MDFKEFLTLVQAEVRKQRDQENEQLKEFFGIDDLFHQTETELLERYPTHFELSSHTVGVFGEEIRGAFNKLSRVYLTLPASLQGVMLTTVRALIKKMNMEVDRVEKEAEEANAKPK